MLYHTASHQLADQGPQHRAFLRAKRGHFLALCCVVTLLGCESVEVKPSENLADDETAAKLAKALTEGAYEVGLPGVAIETLEPINSPALVLGDVCGDGDDMPDASLSWTGLDIERTHSDIKQELVFDVKGYRDNDVEIFASVVDAKKGLRKIRLGKIKNSQTTGREHRVTVPLASLNLSADEFNNGLAAHVAIYAKIDRYENGEAKIGQLYRPILGNLVRDGDGFRLVSHEQIDGKTGEVESVVFIEKGIPVEEHWPEQDEPDREGAATPSDEQPRVVVPDPPPFLTACLKVGALYTDVGIGEDDWTSTGTVFRVPSGIEVKVYRNDVLLQTSYLSDTGCISGFTSAGTYKFTIRTRGKVNNVTMEVKDVSGNYLSSSKTYTWNGTSTESITLNYSGEWARTNVYLAAQHALSGHNSQMGTVTVNYRTGAAGSYFMPSQEAVYISTEHWKEKFVVAHETGHAFAYFADPLLHLIGHDLSNLSMECPDDEGGPGHDLDSEEWIAGAAQEGWAQFYSADAFNGHGADANCYYRTTDANCESASTLYPKAYERTVCGPESGKGTDIDWLRVFWDVHTNSVSGGTTTVSMGTMIDSWIAGASTWNKQGAYAELDNRANTIGGQLNTVWDDAKTDNGVNL